MNNLIKLLQCLINFTGIRSLGDDVLSGFGSMLGIDIGNGDLGSMSPGCQAMLTSLYSNADAITGGSLPSPLNDPALKILYEQGCGESISGLYKYDFTVPIVFGPSSTNTNLVCFGTETEYCMSVDSNTLL